MAVDFVEMGSNVFCDTVIVRIRSNAIPLVAQTRGNRSRTLHSFHCVSADRLAFVDVRMSDGNARVKWIVTCISHSHGFSSFPTRMPRDTLDKDVKQSIRQMTAERRPTASIKIAHNVLCNNDVFYNAVRRVRLELVSEQARALRDAAALSDAWFSEMHLGANNVFVEAFFANARSSPNTSTLTSSTSMTRRARTPSCSPSLSSWDATRRLPCTSWPGGL